MVRWSNGWCVAEGRALVLGLGNLSRQDDGFGWYAVNRVRALLGQPPLDDTDDGMDRLGQVVDTAFLPQVSSDLADLVAQYERLVLVDARIGGEMQVSWFAVEPLAQDQPRLLTHDMLPAELLAVSRALYGHAPRTYVVTVPGLSFDFGMGLSNEMATLVDAAGRLCLLLARGKLPA